MKRVLSLFFAVMMLCCAVGGVDLSAYAQSGDSQMIRLDDMVNPYYEGKINNEDLPADNQARGYFEAENKYATVYSLDKASTIMRDKMVDRVSTLTFDVSTEMDVVSACSYLVDRAMSQEISVSSRDGDYLKWHWYKILPEYKIVKLGAKNQYTLRFTFQYLTTAAQEKEVTNKISSAIKSLKLSDKSDYRKLRLIHNFVCEIAKYDYDHVFDESYKPQFTTHGALIKGVAVCQGYATLFYRLCRETGISCRVITSDDHAWNIAKVGKNYYNIDTTWDDTQTDHYPEKVNNSYWSNDYTFDWFMLG